MKTLTSIKLYLTVAAILIISGCASIEPAHDAEEISDVTVSQECHESTLTTIAYTDSKNNLKINNCNPGNKIVAGEESKPSVEEHYRELDEENSDEPLTVGDIVKETVGGVVVLAFCVLLTPICFM